MKEPKYVLMPGTVVVTHEVIGSSAGILVKQQHLDVRKPNQKGEIAGFVPGHGGDVYWVKHDTSGEVGAYGWWEFEIEVYLTTNGRIYMKPEAVPQGQEGIADVWVEDLQAYGVMVPNQHIPNAWDAVDGDDPFSPSA